MKFEVFKPIDENTEIVILRDLKIFDGNFRPEEYKKEKLKRVVFDNIKEIEFVT